MTIASMTIALMTINDPGVGGDNPVQVSNLPSVWRRHHPPLNVAQRRRLSVRLKVEDPLTDGRIDGQEPPLSIGGRHDLR